MKEANRSQKQAAVVSLMLHDITDTPLSSGFRQPTAQKYKHSLSQFEDYLAVVAGSGLSVASRLPAANDAASVIFTFDDGGVAALTAADVLESHGWRGFFFITTDLIGTPGFLTGRQVRLLSERGHTIGSHSCSHPDVFRALSAVEMQNEWSHSRDKLQQLLGHPVRCASVPGGDIDTATIEQASAAGLKHVFTSEPTTSRWRQAETCCYGRMMMLNSTSARTLKRWLTSPGIGTLPERTVRITKSGIKKAMGPAYQRLIRKRRSQHTCGGDENTVNDSSSGDQPEERCADTSRPAGSRVVALISPGLHCQYTCAELIRAGVNLVGIVEANTKTAGLPVGTLRRLIRKQGLVTTTSQVAARLTYLAANRKSDRQRYQQLFDEAAIQTTLEKWNGPIVSCQSYADDATLDAIRMLKPDILVVHSQSWVDKKVRALASTGLVIGGHPGITPHFRGSHSSFWALLNGQPEQIGWTTFHVDRGVDTGDVIVQGRLNVDPGESYMSLNWLGMKQIAAAQAAAILEYDRTGTIPRTPHSEIPKDSEFGLPGLGDYRRYCRLQAATERNQQAGS